jgi:CPA1 family monovalent cation:H+ antiporter
MRGLVTLAAAFALPRDFPGRDMIVLAAFIVVLGTLVLQGLTLRLFIRILRFPADNSVEREVSRGRTAIMQAALDTLEHEQSPAAAILRKTYAAARDIAKDAARPQASTELDQLRLAAIDAQRRKLEQLRKSDAISDEAYRRLQEETDWAELDAAPAGHFQPLATDDPTRRD